MKGIQSHPFKRVANKNYVLATAAWAQWFMKPNKIRKCFKCTSGTKRCTAAAATVLQYLYQKAPRTGSGILSGFAGDALRGIEHGLKQK